MTNFSELDKNNDQKVPTGLGDKEVIYAFCIKAVDDNKFIGILVKLQQLALSQGWDEGEALICTIYTHLRYFSVAVIKYLNRTDSREKGLIWFTVQRHHRRGRHDIRQGKLRSRNSGLAILHVDSE